MKAVFASKNWPSIVVAILFVVNVVFLIDRFVLPKNERAASARATKPSPAAVGSENSFVYDSPCPDFSKPTIKGDKVKLSDLAGDIIILRFSPFYLEDLPSLLYLDFIANRYRPAGLHLFFINVLGKHDTQSIDKIAALSSPIIEDDGSLLELFQAQYNDTIIIGRDFKMKFKHSPQDNKLIFGQLTKYGLAGHDVQTLPDASFARRIEALSFRDIRTNRLEKINTIAKDRRVLLNLFISPCMRCRETKRISVIKQIAQDAEKRGTRVLLLFGKGNGAEIIREFAEKTDLASLPITVGIIEPENSISEDEYYGLYKFDVDPRAIIIERGGNISYAEDSDDEIRITPNFLIRRLS
jgi:hypothetical protein